MLIIYSDGTADNPISIHSSREHSVASAWSGYESGNWSSASSRGLIYPGSTPYPYLHDNLTGRITGWSPDWLNGHYFIHNSGQFEVPMAVRLEIGFGDAEHLMREKYDPNNEGLILGVLTTGRQQLYNKLMPDEERKIDPQTTDLIAYPLYRSDVLDDEKLLGDDDDDDEEYPLFGPVFGFAAIDNNNHDARNNCFALQGICDHDGTFDIDEDGSLRWLSVAEYGNPIHIIRFLEKHHRIHLPPAHLN